MNLNEYESRYTAALADSEADILERQRITQIEKIEAEIDTLIEDFGHFQAQRHPRFAALMNQLEPLYDEEYQA